MNAQVIKTRRNSSSTSTQIIRLSPQWISTTNRKFGTRAPKTNLLSNLVHKLIMHVNLRRILMMMLPTRISPVQIIICAFRLLLHNTGPLIFVVGLAREYFAALHANIAASIKENETSRCHEIRFRLIVVCL